MSRRNTKDLIPIYMEEFRNKFKDYFIEEIDEHTFAISADGKEWNLINFGYTFNVEKVNKYGDVIPPFNPKTCLQHQRYLLKQELMKKKINKKFTKSP